MNKITAKEYTVVRLNKSNLADMAGLHAAVYGADPPPGFFIKKYDTAYTGTEYAGFIAYNSQGLAVAYYGVIPCFLQYRNETILSAQSADTMTHPQYRYKGMFVDLSNITFSLCRELGIRLVFGFPNQHSYHGAVNKLGWKMTEMMDCFSLTAGSIPLEAISNRFSFLKGIYKRYGRFILEKYRVEAKGVPNSATEDGFAGVQRNEAYLQYKMYNPSQIIQVGESKVWIHIKHGLLIGDMESVNEQNFSAVINELKRIARKLGVKQMQFHCSPGTKLHSLFASHFEAKPSYPVLFQDFGSPIPPEKIKFTLADIDVF